MGAVVAAGTHAPITAILIIFELTSDYKIILPLMISCIISTLLATQIQRSSIYTLKLLRRGIDFSGGRTINVLAHVKAWEVTRDDAVTVEPTDRLMPVITRFLDNPGTTVFVVDQSDRLQGVITINEIRPILADLDTLQPLLIAADLMKTSDYPTFREDDALDEVMRRFGTYRFEAAVLKDGRLVGSIRPEDVIQRYNAELFKRDMASYMSSSLSGARSLSAIPGVRGMSMSEIPVPPSFVSRSIAELDVRKRFNVTILLIKRHVEGSGELVNQLPDARFVLMEGDILLMMGEDRQLRRLERLG